MRFLSVVAVGAALAATPVAAGENTNPLDHARTAVEKQAFPSVDAPHQVLRPGYTTPAVVKLRQALEGLGYGTSRPTSEIYDSELMTVLARFQSDYGLMPDGLYGPKTIAALESPKRRLREVLRVAAEAPQVSIPDNAIVVNIPARTVIFHEDGQAVMTSRAIVGREDRPTPEFTSAITAITFNPPWYVPNSIEEADLLPQLRDDPAALGERGFRAFVQGEDGEWAEAGLLSTNWDEIDASRLRLIQKGGGHSALGRVKFEMPNEHAVFLHDTPDHRLFADPNRTLSSGCVRVQDILEMARRLLGQEAWERLDVGARLLAGETFTVPLEDSRPVVIQYKLAEAAPGGRVEVYPDIYGRVADPE